MTDFEVLSVLISIVIGLGLAHLLSGLGGSFHFRKTNRLDAVHLAWTITVFFILILNWWVALLWLDFEDWTFSVFFLLIVWTITMYIQTLALYPPDISSEADYGLIFQSNRTWLLTTFLIMLILDWIVSAIRDQWVRNLVYDFYIGHYVVIVFIGIFYKNRIYDLVASWYITITLVIWSFVIRQNL